MIIFLSEPIPKAGFDKQAAYKRNDQSSRRFHRSKKSHLAAQPYTGQRVMISEHTEVDIYPLCLIFVFIISVFR